MSKSDLLTAYWITTSSMAPTFGYGVTARSIEDAFAILGAEGYPIDPSEAGVVVRPDITPADLDQLNIVPNIGPIVVRGVWYPFLNLRGTKPRVDWCE